MPSHTLTQVRLIAQLRWRILINSLRSTRAKLETAAYTLVLVVGALVTLAIGMGFYTIAYALVLRGRHAIVLGMLWAIFLAWQFLPVIAAAATTSIEFRDLLRFPVRFSAFLILSLTYSLFDPVALTALFWLACTGAGLVTVKPELLPWILPPFLAFAVMSILLSRITMSWVERIFKKRRGRESFFLLFVLSMLTVSVGGIHAEEYVKPLADFLKANPVILMVLPPDLAYAAVEAAIRGDVAAVLAATGMLALYGGALFLVFWRRLRAQYRGEDLSEGRAASTAPAAAVQEGWRLPWISGALTAMLEKETRYTLRNGFMVMNLVIPLFVPVVFGLAGSAQARTERFFQTDPGVIYFGCITYMLLVTMHVPSNHFAFEGHGIQLLLMAPVRFREVAAAKNLFYSIIAAGEVIAIWLVLTVLGKMPGALATVVTLSAVPFLLLSQLTAGNLLSIHFPRRFDFNKFKQRQSGMSVLLGMVQQILTVGIAGGIFALARWMDRLWMAGLVYLVLGAAMWQAYKIGLDHYENLVHAKREVLTEELCQD